MLRSAAVIVTLMFGSLAFAANNAPSDDGYFLSVLRARVGEPPITNETVTKRTVPFKVSGCVYDRATKGAPINQMAVLKKGLSLKVERVNAQCFTWEDSIEHSYYSPEQFSEIQYEILANGAWLKQSLFVNPWDDKFTFAVDPRELGDLKLVTMKGTDASLKITGIDPVKTRLIGDQIGVYTLLDVRANMTDVFGTKITKNARNGDYVLYVDVLNAEGKVLSTRNYLVSVLEGIVHTELSLPKDAASDTKLRLSIQPVQAAGEELVKSESATLPLSTVKDVRN